MPEPLTVGDIAVLGQATSRGGERRARTLMLAGGLVLLAIHLGATSDPRCTPAVPCTPDAPGSLLTGLVVMVPVLGWLNLWFAPAAAVTMTAGSVWLGHSNPAQASPPWLQVLMAAYATGCVLLAWAAAPGRQAAIRRWRADWADTRTPPAPVQRGRPPLGQALAGTILIACAATGAGLIGDHQAQADRRLAAADTVTATVRSHWDDTTLLLALSGGPTEAVVTVGDPTDYPVGSTVPLAVDEDGLRQLRSEPYDAGPWYVLVSMLAVIGVGIWWRYAARAVARRHFLRRPQPVSGVCIGRRRGDDRLHLYPGQFSSLAWPFGEIPVHDDLAAVVGDSPERAVLYGTPAPGQWCTVTVGPVTLSPKGPLQPVGDSGVGRAIGHLPEPVPNAVDAVPLLEPAGQPTADTDHPEWQEATPVEIIVATVLVLGVMVAGMALREPLLTALFETLCDGGVCDRSTLATVGWSLVGVPAALMVMACLAAGPGRFARWACIAALVLMTGGLALVFPGRHHGSHAIGGTPSPLSLISLGLLPAIAVMALSVKFALPIAAWVDTHRILGRGLRTRIQPEILPLLILLMLELAVLGGVLIGVGLIG